ncbi:MAG: DUF1398 family protein, partial [Rhizobacter sp.]
LIHQVAQGSSDGRLHFGRVIDLLLQADVESYTVDYRTRKTTYYRPNGETLGIELDVPIGEIGREFDVAAIKAAISGSQRGVVKYPEFMDLSSRAGCVSYTVWLAGRHVTYFGRKGESHVERFPN